MAERYVRWDAKSQESPTIHDYRFVVVGDERMANIIFQKLAETLKAVEDRRYLVISKIAKTDLTCYVIAAQSYTLDPTQFAQIDKTVYSEKIRRDRDICSRNDDSSLIKLVEEKAQAGKFPFF